MGTGEFGAHDTWEPVEYRMAATAGHVMSKRQLFLSGILLCAVPKLTYDY
jgi:hypothetical protein